MQTKRLVPGNVGSARDFASVLGWTEIFQEDYTRVGCAVNEDGESYQVTTLAWLDRLYTNMNPIDLLDLRPSVATFGSVLNRSHLSDHTPVRGSIDASENRKHKPNIPSWITKLEKFPILIDEYLMHVDMDDCSFKNLEEAKEAMYAAAQVIRYHTYEHGAATTQHKTAVALEIWRAAVR